MEGQSLLGAEPRVAGSHGRDGMGLVRGSRLEEFRTPPIEWMEPSPGLFGLKLLVLNP